MGEFSSFPPFEKANNLALDRHDRCVRSCKGKWRKTMISQRTSGLYHLVVLVQCLLISVLYWALVTTFYCYHTTFSLDGYRVYAIPYAFALIGLLAAAPLSTDALASLLRKDI